MRKEDHSVFAIAGTYVGTVVGAGFATGQEVMRFFTFFGPRSTIALIVATLLFAVLGSATLRVAHGLNATSQKSLLNEVTGPLLGRFLDWVLALFLFAGAAIMMAGSGAVFAEHWHVSRMVGTALMAAISVGTVMLGLRGVVASISAVAPVLITMVLLIAGATVFTQGISPAAMAYSAPAQAASPWWPVSMLLYVSYNLLFSVSVLAPLGGQAADERKLHLGGVIGGAALGIGALAINLALLSGMPGITRYEVPMLYMAGRLSPWIASAYSLVLWAEIYTTAVSSLYGLAVRFVPEGNQNRYRWFVLGAGAAALVFSQLGFAQMVAIIFPAVGWLGLLYIAALGIRLLQRRGAPLR